MISAIVQARMSSSRFSGKVLQPILGQPMLARQIERIRLSATIDQVTVATSTEFADDPIASACTEMNVPCFRGSLDDVLDRFYRAAELTAADVIVRLTADCPLLDPDVIDATVRLFLSGAYDYVSNSLVPTYPDGLDTEVFRRAALVQAHREATKASEREHVTSYIWGHPDKFRIGMLKNDRDLSAHRWTVDHPEDFELVTRVFEVLYPKNPAFRTKDVLEYLSSHPEVLALNSGHIRNEGFQKSILAD